MSSISFDASLNTDKLESSIKQSNKTVKEWAQGVEKAGTQADKGLDKMTKSFKEAISEQKALIKSIEQEINKLQKAYDSASASQKKSNIAVDLRSAKSSLAIQNEKLLELQERQINSNAKETQTVDTLTGSITKWALSLGGATAALKLIKDALLATTAGLNAFNIAGAAAKQVMYNLVTGSIDLTKGIQEVVQAQRELNRLRLQDKLDTYDARVEMLKYNEALIDAKDQTKSVAERIEAYDKAIAHKKKSTEIELQSTKDQIAAYQKIVKQSPGNEKAIITLIDLQTRLIDLQIRETSAMKEISSMRSGLIKKQEEDAKKKEEERREKLKKATEDEIRIYNSVAEQKKLLDEAIKKGNDTEIKAITERIVELEKELKLREELAQQIINAAYYEADFVPSSVKSPGLEGVSSAIVGKTKEEKRKPKTLAEIQNEMNQLKPISDKLIEAAEEADRLSIEAGNRKIENQQQLIAGASELVYMAGEQLGLGEEELRLLDAKLQAIGQFASGNYIGAAVTTVMSVVSSFMSLLPNQSEKLDNQIEHINQLLIEQQRLIELSAREGGETSARKSELEELKRLREVQEAALAKAEKTLTGGDFWNSQRKMKRAEETWHEMTEAIKETDYEILQATQDLNDFFTGTDQRSIASAISQGLKDSESSAADYAETFYNFMRGAIDNALEDALSIDLTPWYKQFAADMASGGGLTDEETANLKRWYDDIIEKGKANREAAYAIAGISSTPSEAINNGLSMGIRRDISEQTGTELAGLFRRFADDNRQTKDYTLAGLNHLVGIERNTLDTVFELKNAVSELKAINSNTKQSAVAGF